MRSRLSGVSNGTTSPATRTLAALALAALAAACGAGTVADGTPDASSPNGGGNQTHSDGSAPLSPVTSADSGSLQTTADAQAPDQAGEDASTPTGGDDVTDPYSTDRARFLGSSRCTDGMMLCDGFETVAAGAKADSAVWETLGDRITVEATLAARGKQALHVVTKSNEALHFLRTTRIVKDGAHSHWGRLFFRVEGARPSAFNHWTVVEATGTVPEGGTARVRYGGIQAPGQVNHLLFNYDIWGGRPAGFGEVGYDGKPDIPDQTWHCLEWMFDVDARQTRVFMNAVEDPTLAGNQQINGTALSFPLFDGLNIGWAIYQDIGTSSWDVWVDEVAVDKERIGCVR